MRQLIFQNNPLREVLAALITAQLLIQKFFLPNVTKDNEFVKKDNEIDRKDYNYKVCYNLRLNNEEMQPKRIIVKTLKFDENNQYGFGMTKRLPTGCIKIDSDIMQKLDIDSSIGHLYVVDIEFDHKNATQNQIVPNEIYPPIIDKQKMIDPCERSSYQLLEQYSTTEKGKARSYGATKKAHATMFKKRFQPLYLEQAFFCCCQSRMGNYKNIYSLYF